MAEIYEDERGVELLKAQCHGRTGCRTLDPRHLAIKVVTGKVGLVSDGKWQSLGFPEEVEMAKHWLTLNGIPETPIIELGGE